MTAGLHPAFARLGAPAVHVLTLEQALGMGQPAWDTLCGRMHRPTPFALWAWHRAWADAAPARERDACRVVVATGDHGELEALLPVTIRMNRLRRWPVPAVTWATGDFGCPDHLDVIGDPEADMRGLARALAGLGAPAVMLANLEETAPGARRLAAALTTLGYRIVERPQHQCSHASLPASWEAFLGRRGRKTRSKIRGYEKRMFERHHATVTRYDSPERVEEGLRKLEQLHERRWGGLGSFGRDPRFGDAQRRFAMELAREGRLQLATLEVDGQAVAVDYSMIVGDTCFGYVCGRDPAWRAEGAGRVMMGLTIQRAIARGCREMDFLRGDEPYKVIWATGTRRTWELLATPPTVAGHALHLIERVGAWRARQRPIAASTEPDADWAGVPDAPHAARREHPDHE